jgi:nicotinamide riboside kinase
MISRVISLTGAQSTGKSTILNTIHSEYGNLKALYFEESTRYLKKKFDFPINDESDSYDETQLAIANYHLDNLLKSYMQNSRICITDRCIVDCFVYSVYLYRHDKLRKRTLEYIHDLMTRYLPQYKWVLYADPTGIPLQNDGVRSINAEFRKEIIEIFEEKIKIKTYSNVVLVTGSKKQRIEIVKNLIK